MSSEYTVWYFNPTRTARVPLVYSKLDYARRQNEVGTLTINPLPVYPFGTFQRDGQIEVHRSVDDRIAVLHLDTVWFVHRITYENTEEGEQIIELQAHDNTGLLARRVVAYDPDTSYTRKTGYMDDVMKTLVKENFGVNAIEAGRDVSTYLSVAANQSLGPLLDQEVPWQNVYDVAKKLADAASQDGTKLFFDIVSLENATTPFEFRTWTAYRGVDHSAASGQTVLFAEEMGNLTNPRVIWDYTEEGTFAYAPGKGSTQSASDAARIGLGPFMRIERVTNSSSDDVDVLANEAKAELKKGRPRLLFEGRIRDAVPPRYGIHYEYGDLVTAQYMGYKIDCVVDSVHVTIDQEQGENLDILLKGEQVL